jgi:hypothetical protein
MTVRGLARRFGLSVEIADLGDWGKLALCSEYDHAKRVARLNQRVLRRLPESLREGFATFALAHELYHHLSARRARQRRLEEEAAATRFAERLTASAPSAWIARLTLVSEGSHADRNGIRARVS